MRTFIKLLSCILLPLIVSAQGYKIVPFETVSQIADRNAEALWSEVYPSEPLALYGQDDEIIAWLFNYSIGKPFPEKDWLIRECGHFAAQNMTSEQWGTSQFANIMISARNNLPVVQEYSQQLSIEYALGYKLQQMLVEKFGPEVPRAGKAYFLGDLDIWHEYSTEDQVYYFCPTPAGGILSKDEFTERKESAEPFCIKGDFREEWDNYENGFNLGGRGDVYIYDHEIMPYYDWSYGCGPTAIAMLLGYHDYRSLNSVYKYANLISHHFERWDHLEEETDRNVPEIQKLVAFFMGTDSMTYGFTHPHLMDNGVEYIANTLKGYNFDATNVLAAPWTKIQPNIDNNRPLIGRTWNHYPVIIGYRENTDMIHTRWTWRREITTINRYRVLGVTVVVPGGSSGNAVQLSIPFGDPRYNANGAGEVFMAGNYHEISWVSDDVPGSTVDISYSVNGGLTFTKFVTNKPNTGFHNWFVPSHLESNNARIRIDLHTPTKEYAGADGSYGNFKINPGGSVTTLEHAGFYANSGLTKYYRFQHAPDPVPRWGVVGVYPEEPLNPWTCELWDQNFLNLHTASTSTTAPQNIVVLDANHLPSDMNYGVKIRKINNDSFVNIQFQRATELLSWIPGVEIIRGWNSNTLVRIFDLDLSPGQYFIKLNHKDPGMDLDMALFSTTDGVYFKNLSEAAYISSNAGNAPEWFVVNITETDRYGLCIFARETVTGYFGITISDAFIWTGNVNNNWHNANNWSGLIVPGADDKVSIPPASNYPIVSSGPAFCSELNLLQGGHLRLNSQDLTVTNDAYLKGLMEINGDRAMIVNGNVVCMQSASIILDEFAGIQVQKDWTFDLFSSISSNIGYVSMTGNSNSKIYCKSANSWFPNLKISKIGASVSFEEEHYGGKAPISSYPLVIKKQFTIFPNAHFIVNSTKNTFIRDVFLTYSGSQFSFNHGTVVFDMPGSGTFALNNPTASYFNNIEIDFLGTLQLSSGMNVHGNLQITRGTLNANGNNIKIGGNWNRSNNGTFQHGNARVIFNGSGNQTVRNTGFWTLEMNKSSGWLGFLETSVICQFYDWTAGTLRVDGGIFNIGRILDAGIYGNVIVESGELNLHQDPSQFVDLNGNLTITGGTVKITGGFGESYWPWDANASITMSGGVLDFYDVGIVIYSSATYSLSSNITGGTIRTRGNLTVQRTDFNPSGGTFEFYGINDDAYVSVNAPSNLYNLLLTKATEGKEKGIVKTLIATGTLDINGDFILDRGIFEAPPSMKVAGNFVNLQSQSNFVELTGQVILDGNSSITINHSETFYDLTIDKTGSGSVLINNNRDLIVKNILTVERGLLGFKPGSALFLDGSFESNYGADVRFMGTESGNILVSSASKTNYAFDVNGGAIGAVHTVFENMDVSGINLLSYVDPDMAFHHCTFRNGAAGGTLITWNQGATITVENAIFPENTTGSAYNVTKTADHGNVFFDNATGSFAGSTFENDPYSRVHWEYIPPFELPFYENWSSGNFETNYWVKTADNWVISTSLGNTAPAATFHYSPRIFNYSADLRSHYLNAKNHSEVFLKYDIKYINYSSSTLEQLEVRAVLNNDDFITLASYNNAAGSFGFISETFNISTIAAGNEIRIYFRAFGEDSWNIDDWIIDNIQVYGTLIQPATLNGMVYDEVTDLPIENALIAIEGTSLSAYSLISGQYTIHDIPPGIYDVTATADGYEPSTSEAIEFLPGENVIKDFPMILIPPAYCTQGLYSYGCDLGDGLEYFELSTIQNHFSGCSENGYGDFTGLTTDISRGYEHSVFFSSDYMNQYVSLWIDFNDNFEFEASERVLTNFFLANPGEIYETKILIPEEAPLGEHRLRVRTNWSASSADPCAEYMYGEAEDYTVNITEDILFGLLYATLTDHDIGEPVAGAVVEITGASLYGITEAEGICIIEFIEPGSYNIQISANGYQSLSIPAFNINGNELNYLTETLIPGMPTNLQLRDRMMLSGEIDCFAATQTIIVAGNGSTFIVESGGEAELVAGENIIMLPGTRVMDAGYMLARITLTIDYCSNPESIVSIIDDAVPTEYLTEPIVEKHSFFRIYPNPTAGRFTLEITCENVGNSLAVEIYDLMGKTILNTKLTPQLSHIFDFSPMQPGVYILKVMCENETSFLKLIRQ